MAAKTAHISSWNNYPIQFCKLIRPEKYRDLFTPSSTSIITRGQGRSYGDAALNNNGTVLLTERLNRFLVFDKIKGILKAEAGITLAEILAVIIPAGWFLPVIPGTQFVSLGGCIAADVHGKNHHRSGSFSQYVIEIELISAASHSIICSASQHADDFWATVGGMGLTGIIGTVTLQLIPISSCYLLAKYLPAANLETAFTLLADADLTADYSVAWLDGLATNKQLGRSIIMNYQQLAAHELPPSLQQNPLIVSEPSQINIPINFPSRLLNRHSIKIFNNYYYSKQSRKNTDFIVNYYDCFFPLDKLKHWNRLYGKTGFVQYQCVFPTEHALTGVKVLLEKLTNEQQPACLGVLKRLGANSKGLLSFPMPGYTLALDIPFYKSTVFQLLDELDAIVIKYQGRTYLAKDARLNAINFRLMYPNYNAWLKQKSRMDPLDYFQSSLSRRLQLGLNHD